MPPTRIRSIILAIACIVCVASATIHDFEVADDPRNVISIDEGFGFIDGGHMHISLSNFRLKYGVGDTRPELPIVGILIYRSQRVLRDDISAAVQHGVCLFKTKFAESDEAYLERQHFFGTNSTQGDIDIFIEKTSKNEGFYRAFFVNCEQMTTAWFTVHLNYSNPGPTYLTAGLMPMPVLYGVSAVLFTGALAGWVVLLVKRREKVMKIHIIMAVTIFVKVCTLVAQAVRYEWIKTTGFPNGWNVIFYIFQFFKVSFVFGVIGVVGSGFMHFRAYVPTNVKKVLLFVIPAQVLANIAQIVVQEEAPGVFGWSSWNAIFVFVDIFCCVAIIAPVEWTLRHLKEGDREDARAARHVKLFRSFYYWVVAYLYCTRIVFVLWDMYILFHVSWMPRFADEVLALVFFVVTGFKFAPPGSGYFRVNYTSDDEGDAAGAHGGEDGEGADTRGSRIEMEETGDAVV